MKKLFITLCGIAVLSSITGFASAEDKGCPKSTPEIKTGTEQNRPEFVGRHHFTPEMKAKFEQKRAEFDKKLNLTPDQKAKMKAVHQASRAQIKPLFEQMKAERAKMKQLESSSASKDAIAAERTKIHQIREQLKTIRKADFEKIQAFLTPDQQALFNKMHEERKNRMNSHKHNFDKK